MYSVENGFFFCCCYLPLRGFSIFYSNLNLNHVKNSQTVFRSMSRWFALRARLQIDRNIELMEISTGKERCRLHSTFNSKLQFVCLFGFLRASSALALLCVALINNCAFILISMYR